MAGSGLGEGTPNNRLRRAEELRPSGLDRREGVADTFGPWRELR